MTAKAWVKAYEWEQALAEAAVAQPSADVPVAPAGPRPAVVVAAPVKDPADGDDGQELLLENLTREQVLDWRNRAAADHQIVHDRIARYGEASAQRLSIRGSSRPCSAYPVSGTWTSATPRGSRCERRRDVRRRSGPSHAAGRGGGAVRRS
ncbi:hypothetical protein [Streptomyces eurocidicus]|uniref:Uncharacterized protein n=1 Tax=Streptomyces eurocidicus TaxID=66423 RepID=A0A7W8F4S0_STREU|nr:hypothetical protein [Streptomyces eurocidicus]MBB5123168.1 hypothetical protein [Streptomyces eurocidicus]